MKHIYKLLMVLIAVAAGWGQKATAQNSGGFGYYANCLKVSLFAQDKRAFDSCAQVKFTLNGTYVTGTQASYTFPSAGTYTVCMKIYNSCKKWDTSICQNITVKACSSCDWSKAAWSYKVDCRKITLEGNNLLNSCYKYAWSVNGTTLNGRVAYYNFSNDGTYKICMKVYDSCNRCDTTICKEVKIACSSKCNFSGAGFAYSAKCRDYVFEGKNLNNGCLKYQFYVNGNNQFITLNPGRVVHYTFPSNGTYQVKMIVKDTCNNCDTFIYQTVNVNCSPCNLKPEFAWKNDCLKAYFKAGTVSGATYYWSFGDGYYSSLKEPWHQFIKAGTYKVCLKVTYKDPNTGQTCSETICREVTIKCGNDCNLKGDFQLSRSGNSVKLSANSNNGYYYFWSFGDGTTGSGKQPTHYYKKPGTYEICVTIYDKTKKCSVKICKKVVIPEQCNVRAYFVFKTNGNGTVNFQGIAYNGGKFIWSFGDGTSGTGKNPSHTYKQSGTYIVCLKVYSTNGKCYTTICKKVVIHVGAKKCDWAKLGVNFSYNINCPNLILEGKNLNSTGNNCYSYGWGITPAGTNQTTTYYGRTQQIKMANGVYNVCMKVYDSCHNCDTVICKTITINCGGTKCDWSKVNTQISLSTKCRTIVASANPGGNCIKMLWYFNGSNTGEVGHYRTWSVKADGTYKVCLKLYDSCNRCDTVICKEVKVDCPDKKCDWSNAGFSYKVDCNKVTWEANNLNNNCITYYFYSGNTFLNGGRTGGKIFTQNGSYTICLKLKDSCNNCDTSICQTIKINCQPCKAQAKFTVDSVGTNGVAYITNHSSGAYAYIWDFGDSTYSYSANPGKHAYASSGYYVICLTVYDSSKSCSTKYCYQIKVVKSRASVAGISAQPVVKVFPNPADNYFSIVSSTGIGSYEVLNLQGRSIAKGDMAGGKLVSTDGWPEGVYIVRTTFGNSIVNTRLIVGRQ